jgi:hypothetical protein
MTFFKKKLFIALSVILLLASCSASAHGEIKKPESISNIKPISVEKSLKLHRNYYQMLDLVKYLKTRVNRTPYVFSGASTHGWDCSGMVYWFYKQFGLEIPHSANKQGHIGYRVSKPKLGDIVVMAHRGGTNFYHAGLYVGDNKVLNSNAYYGTTVIEELTDYKNSEVRYVRLVETKK